PHSSAWWESQARVAAGSSRVIEGVYAEQSINSLLLPIARPRCDGRFSAILVLLMRSTASQVNNPSMWSFLNGSCLVTFCISGAGFHRQSPVDEEVKAHIYFESTIRSVTQRNSLYGSH